MLVKNTNSGSSFLHSINKSGLLYDEFDIGRFNAQMCFFKKLWKFEIQSYETIDA